MNKTLTLAPIALFAFLATGAVDAAESDQKITVYKSETCGCCEVWTNAMQKVGHPVEIHHLDDLTEVKATAGVPDGYESCHTAIIDLGRSYVLEGHVPLEAIEKLAAELPDIKGLAVPGMPSGSLGMGGSPEPYTVYAFTDCGQVLSEAFLEVTD